MPNLFPRRLLGLGALLALACSHGGREPNTVWAATVEHGAVTRGDLLRIGPEGEPEASCPLKHTDVEVEISGFLARVKTVQTFHNDSAEAIEAVYVFPLSQRSAVDDMTMRIGDRTVKGKIKPREEARAIYDAARARGHLASLLDQERPNIFTQSVANIPPGAQVEIEISYVETMKYEEGTYEFSYPMVVGPRYIPGNITGHSGGGWAPDTDQVPDASKITPPVTKPGTRAGHDISVAVSLDAGLPVDRILSKTHEVDVERPSSEQARIRLKNKAVLPNKDFVLTYDVAGARIQDAFLTHYDSRGGFFTLVLQPPERVTVEDVTPKELVFVLDTSGSMSGMPIEKAKEVIKLAIDGLYPRDTFNLITFAGTTHVLFPEPVAATHENVRKAQDFIASRQGGGGTEMMKAIRVALDPSDSQEHLRIVCFLTDGYVGNDMAILGEIQRHSNTRVFSFGIGNSVNRFLLDKMADLSRGEVEYVGLQDDGSAAARRFHERVRNPLLTDIRIDWGGLPVSEVFPTRIPDLFSAKPVVVTGRYTGGAKGVVRLAGKMSGEEFVRPIQVDFPGTEPEHDVLATLWARHKVDSLMAADWSGMQNGNPRPDVREEITRLGVEFRLLTQFTSFVAVEESIITEGGRPKRIEVPVEMPQGVSYEGVFGSEEAKTAMRMVGGAMPQTASFQPSYVRQAPVASSPALEAVGRREKDALQDEAIERKLHPDLVKLLAGGAVPSVTTRANAVAVAIWLDDANAELVARLKLLGFQPSADSKVAKVLTGWLPIAKLREVALMNGVRFVAPHRVR